MKIVIVNCGIANCGSVLNMLSLFSKNVSIIDRPEEILDADKIILPGVGAFDEAMQTLKSKNFVDILNQKVLKEKVPVLGICLGMQLLGQRSKEGVEGGLNWLPSRVQKFDMQDDPSIKVPHMGWNIVNAHNDCPLLTGYDEPPRFYFAHSYHYEPNTKASVGWTRHGDKFPSVVMKDNIFGVQFHPEKSHKYGKKLMENFVNL